MLKECLLYSTYQSFTCSYTVLVCVITYSTSTLHGRAFFYSLPVFGGGFQCSRAQYLLEDHDDLDFDQDDEEQAITCILYITVLLKDNGSILVEK